MAEYLSPAVYIEELSSGIKPIQGVGTSVGAFVGHAERGPIGLATRITNYGQFVQRFGGPIDDGYLAFAVKAFFDEGGSSCWIVRTCHYTAPTQPTAVTSSAIFQNGGGPPINALRVNASSPGSWGNILSIEIAHSVPPVIDRFSITIRRAGTEEQVIRNLSMNPDHQRYAPTVVEQESNLLNFIRVADLIVPGSVVSPADRRPAPTTSPQPLVSGADGLTNLTTSDYIGDATASTGLHALSGIDEVNIVTIPDAVDRQVHVEGMAYCEARRDCIYVADTPEQAITPVEILNFKQAQGLYSGGNALNSKYGALYGPWVHVLDPRNGSTIPIPPGGAALGRMARTDQFRGVHKAPARVVDGRLASVTRLSANLSFADQEILNPRGINIIRRFSGVGNAIWGARTVSSDPEWRYLNVRRLFLFLEESIEESTNWIVFEPNDPSLWKSITRNISAFLRLQWSAGALVGVTEEEAFFVKCDEETNPIESRKLGRVITEIGVAPSKPAEFVIFRLEQFDGGSEVSE